MPTTPQSLSILLHLLFPPAESTAAAPVAAELKTELTSLNGEGFKELLDLAHMNHVEMRAFEVALGFLRESGDETRAGWMTDAMDAERARIRHAVSYLHRICSAFEEEGLDATVIKSLDHWPDMGSDLDLYSNAAPEKVVELMVRRFQAKLEPRSWGDRLACKWNFAIPGLPESVEIHVGRLGQTGEQIVMASRIAARARTVHIEGQDFRVPAISDRLMISTLQRMYRHFYFRLCDVLDSTEIAEAGAIDYRDLRDSASASGIWEGAATYLVIVSDYVKNLRGKGLELPRFVTDAARFGGSEVYFARGFLRVPIMPQSARLYGTQLGGLLRKRELESSARLGLLPWLATAAAVGQKLTGSDKGIW